MAGLPLPLWPGWPPLGLPDLPRWLRVRLWVPLFLRRPSLAGGLLLVVLSSAALRSGGSTMERIIKVNIYLTDMSNFPKIVDLREKHFTKPYPADTIVEVSSLALPELMIEIEAIGLVEGEIID